jgi:hypothetical protein
LFIAAQYRWRREQTSFSRNLRLSDYVMRNELQPQQDLKAAPANDGAIKARTRERMIMETPAKQAPTASSEPYDDKRVEGLIDGRTWVILDRGSELCRPVLFRFTPKADVRF